MKDTLNLFDLETLFQRGMELNVWKVPEENKLGDKNGLFGAVIYNSDEVSPSEMEMGECSYAPTIIEAINLAVKKGDMMEVVSDNYGKTKRTVDVHFYRQDPPFASLRIWEEVSSVLAIRFNPDKKEDLLFFDQLRAAINKVGKFLRP